MPRFNGQPVEETGGKFGGVPVEQDPSFMDILSRQLGRTVRIGADAVAALPLTVLDAAAGLSNELLGTHYNPSETWRQGLNSIGLPEAANLPEKAVDVIGQGIIAGKLMPNDLITKIGVKNPAPSNFNVKPDLTQKVVSEGVKHNVPVYYDDVGGIISKKAGTAAENVPVLGTAGGRKAQFQAATRAAQKISDKYNVGEDVPDLIQKGMKNKLTSFKRTAGKLYDKAANMLDHWGNVPTSTFDTEIQTLLEAEKRLGTAANQEVIKLLQKYADAPRGNFSLMREIRSQLGSDLSGFYKGNSPIGEKGAGAIQSIKTALENDMSTFADKVGGTARAVWRKADAFYREGVIPFKSEGLRALTKTAEPEKAWRYLISDTKSRALRMYKSLDGSGRSAVRYGLIKDAMQKAETKDGISPAKFAKYLEKHQNLINTFFKGDELKEIQGFKVLMRSVERAGQFMENPPTGNRVVPFLIGGAAVKAPLAVGGGAAIVGATRVLFQTKTGRNALIALSKWKPGTPQSNNTVKYINGLVATQRDKLNLKEE